jgi:5-methylcytosine-specific restriction enzyme B
VVFEEVFVLCHQYIAMSLISKLPFSKTNIIKGIESIQRNPGLRNGRESSEYDLIFKGERYPPILVLSEANKLLGGSELTLRNYGNSTSTPFKILRDLGFEIISKENVAIPNIWIEKTIVAGRQDRLNGEYALGKRLWSPTKDKRGGDIYSNLRKVNPNDIVLHLTNNKCFNGVSKVQSKFVEGNGVVGTEWEGDAYIIELKNFIEIKPLDRDDVLNEENKRILELIKSNQEVFYDKDLKLRQGAYLTPCSLELAALINNCYFKVYNTYIPFLPLPTSMNIQTNPTLDKLFQIREFKDDLKSAGLQFNDKLLTRFIASLITKPFVILTGLSGSGKTKLAQAFATWICQSTTQYLIVPVGADWTNREPLLGYPNALNKNEYIKPENGVLDLIIEASKNSELPHFLILDEMNLSHVERYFADFLSAMESGNSIGLGGNINTENNVPSKLYIPKKLFIIGTVNIDETTNMFSPKVLDRANTIEFRVSANELSQFLEYVPRVDISKLSMKGASMARSFVIEAKKIEMGKNDLTKIKNTLNNFFDQLEKIGSEFGYRTAFDIIRLNNQLSIIDNTLNENEKIDITIIQKLLPKLHGSRRKLVPVLIALGNLCVIDSKDIEKNVFITKSINPENTKFPLSLEKIVRMYQSAIDNGFASFAEA